MDVELMHPHSRYVDAYVGPFQQDYLGLYTGKDAPKKAMEAAKKAGYELVSLMYGNGNMEIVPTSGSWPEWHGHPNLPVSADELKRLIAEDERAR